MRLLCLSIILCGLLGVLKNSPCLAMAYKEKKHQILDQMGSLFDRLSRDLQQYENKIKKLVHDSSKLSSDDFKSKNESLKIWVEKRKEYSKKLVFINRLKHRIQLSYTGQENKAYFTRQLNHLVEREALSKNPDHELILYIRNLAFALQSSEGSDRPLAFIKDYLNKTSPLNSQAASEFNHNRDYTNGSQSQKAKNYDREKLGEYLESVERLNTQPKTISATAPLPQPQLKPVYKNQAPTKNP